jgi:hypothetical protein
VRPAIPCRRPLLGVEGRWRRGGAVEEERREGRWRRERRRKKEKGEEGEGRRRREEKEKGGGGASAAGHALAVFRPLTVRPRDHRCPSLFIPTVIPAPHRRRR